MGSSPISATGLFYDMVRKMKTRFKEFYWDDNGDFVLELLNGEKYVCRGTHINNLTYGNLESTDTDVIEIHNEKTWDVNDLQRIRNLSGGLIGCTIPPN